ncbi:MAG TPA: HRDC domain-containing protein [Anaerolineales bacterium]|nr:HRDC domain-containing protein [Anaerolineales bacterium]
MSQPDLLAPNLLTRTAQLRALADKLSAEPLIAVDTESNSLHAYQEQVCLIQFSIPESDFLVDPLSLDDLSPLAPLFADPKHEKIFHAAEYDLICLKRDFDFTFANVFDTMFAARILGRKKVGLGSMLEEEFHVVLDKKYQRANWGQRPLPSYLRVYAQLDTHYLIPLRNHLREQLQRKKRWPLAKEDFTRLCQINGREPTPKEDWVWRINGARDLTPKEAAVLQELCFWREEMAEKLDRPVFKVMNDHLLVTLAQRLPLDRAELQRAGMTDRQIHRFGPGVLAAISRGAAAPPLYPPTHPRPDEDFLNRMEALSDWRKHRARSLGVESDVVLPREHVSKIARHNPPDEAALLPLMDDIPWRYEQFRKQILHVLERMN